MTEAPRPGAVTKTHLALVKTYHEIVRAFVHLAPSAAERTPDGHPGEALHTRSESQDTLGVEAARRDIIDALTSPPRGPRPGPG